MTESYTRITNKILDALCRAKINLTQNFIIRAIIRATYGFNKKSYEISINFIARSTGIDRANITRELNKLIEMKVVKVYKEAGGNKGREIGVNEFIQEWTCGFRKESTQGGVKSTTQGGVKSTTQGGVKSTTQGGVKSTPKKENIYKEKREGLKPQLTPAILELFERFKDMRKEIKKPMAISEEISYLEKFVKYPEEQVLEKIQYSLDNSYHRIFIDDLKEASGESLPLQTEEEYFQ